MKIKCVNCKAKGKIEVTDAAGNKHEMTCPQCNGHGEVQAPMRPPKKK